MTSVNTQMILDGLKAYTLTAGMQAQFEEWNNGGFWDKIKAIFLLVPMMIGKAEDIANDLELVQAGGAKRDAVVKFIDDAIKTPIWIEPFDGTIIGVGVDALVGFVNLTAGKRWLAKIKEVFGL